MSEKRIQITLSERELIYLIQSGSALITNISENALTTYCGFNKEEILEFSSKMREIADKESVSW
ncbi:hypothetical protein [Litoribrevibacter albus]|uniref:Uncharacterized protein n=1 Tax=Litoribrevibacter albus TaxID=1473156 RepID=A0AA37S8C0_9GAMM|nr:hypothetical protein [Litoribrevibacter albus]GLQ30256.1 hypothetical protein GCM10007876_07340 [Litoribrevibacter albus]